MTYIVRRSSPELAHLLHLDPLQVAREMSGWEPFQGLTPFRFVSRPVPAFAPTFEAKEPKGAFIFRADLPGVEEKNIEISLTGNLMTVNGLRDQEDRHEGENFFVDERMFGSFTRAFTLPDGVDGEHVNADLKDGVLTLRIPKKPEHQPKKISIKVAEKAKAGNGGPATHR